MDFLPSLQSGNYLERVISATEGADLARDGDRVVVSGKVAGPREHSKLCVGQQVKRLLGR